MDFDHTQLDDLIHSRIRLAVMSILAASDAVEFTFIRDRTKTTDGNLSTHLRKLEDAGYIQVEKEFVGRKPVSRYSLTDTGRQAFTAYVERLEQMLPGRGDT
ncbi:MAG: transcriptional regulator [Gammaproteobacteria bacterium]|nr:transcriptional regulator [Gammaproteobacteria bacterium]